MKNIFAPYILSPDFYPHFPSWWLSILNLAGDSGCAGG